MPDSIERFAPATDLALDEGIRRYVLVLRSGGVETFESCEGGLGHAFAEPTVRFHGNAGAGFHALSVAMDHGLPVSALRRIYQIEDGWPVGPWWELTFATTDQPH
jgi:hypothetical protein